MVGICSLMPLTLPQPYLFHLASFSDHYLTACQLLPATPNAVFVLAVVDTTLYPMNFLYVATKFSAPDGYG